MEKSDPIADIRRQKQHELFTDQHLGREAGQPRMRMAAPGSERRTVRGRTACSVWGLLILKPLGGWTDALELKKASKLEKGLEGPAPR